MTRTLLIVAGSVALCSIAFAQDKAPAKPAAPAAAAPKAPGQPSPRAPGAMAPKKGAGQHPAHHGEGKPEHAEGKPEHARAQHPGAPGAPKPPPELDEAFKYFMGGWRCESKMPAGAMAPDSPEMTSKSSVRFKKTLGGFAYQGDYQMRRTKTMPGMKATMLITYQPAAKVFTITSTDNMGNVEYATAPGFQGDTITFLGEGYMMGQKVKIRETMTKKPDTKQGSHTYEVDMGQGFKLLGTDECKR